MATIMTPTSTTLASLVTATMIMFCCPADAARPASDPVATTTRPEAMESAAPFQIDGFRTARFGMSPQQVIAASALDFGADVGTEIVDGANGHPRAVVVRLAALEPGPGAATVTYLFDDRTALLMHVNVVWTTSAEPSTAERAAIADGGVRLTAYFTRMRWAAGATTTMAAPDASYAILFAGVDPTAASVEVKASGVKLARRDGVRTEGTGPAVLRIAYAGPPRKD